MSTQRCNWTNFSRYHHDEIKSKAENPGNELLLDISGIEDFVDLYFKVKDVAKVEKFEELFYGKGQEASFAAYGERRINYHEKPGGWSFDSNIQYWPRGHIGMCCLASVLIERRGNY